MTEKQALIALRGKKSIPATLTVPAAGMLLGMSRSAAYRAVAAAVNGEPSTWPTPVICVGDRRSIPTIHVLDELGLTELLGPGLVQGVLATLTGLENEADDLGELNAG